MYSLLVIVAFTVPFCKFVSALGFLLVNFLVLLSDIINSPAEKAVKSYYINDAKKILASRKNLRIIGITGSYGKTSCKYFLTKLLSPKYNVLMTPASYNTPMGVVKTIREQLKNSHEIFVCEMGAKNLGDIKELCELVHPQTGLISSIGPQHLESFKSIENVVKTKFELYDEVIGKGKMYTQGAVEQLYARLVVVGDEGDGDPCLGEGSDPISDAVIGLGLLVRSQSIVNVGQNGVDAQAAKELGGDLVEGSEHIIRHNKAFHCGTPSCMEIGTLSLLYHKTTVLARALQIFPAVDA